MQLFTTYYENIPISFYANLKEEFSVNKMLQNPKLAHFFEDKSKVFISTVRVNDLKHINRFMAEVNDHIEVGDCFFGYFETFSAKRSKSQPENKTAQDYKLEASYYDFITSSNKREQLMKNVKCPFDNEPELVRSYSYMHVKIHLFENHHPL